MDLKIANQLFIVGGASSGLGRAIANALVKEGASIIAIARRPTELEELKLLAPNQVSIIVGDLTTDTLNIMNQCDAIIGSSPLHGILINAGGPPAKTVMETTLQDWDEAYANILRWKIMFVQHFLPKLIEQKYGRVLCLESSSVKQPIENLVLSNSLRLAVVGFVKTLSQEVASTGVNINVIAPGSHNTPAIKRLYDKKVLQTGLPFDEVKEAAINQIPTKRLGEAEEFASLALWMLSPLSTYITGQTFSVDGGAVKSTF